MPVMMTRTSCLASVCFLSFSCAGSFLHGAKIADRDYSHDSPVHYQQRWCGVMGASHLIPTVWTAPTPAKEAPAASSVPLQTCTQTVQVRIGGNWMDQLSQVPCSGGATPIPGATSTTDSLYVPPGKFTLLPDRSALFESGTSGILIQNHWTAADGDHYFTWVTNGWEYIFPKEPGALATLLWYKNVTVEKFPDGTTHPTGGAVSSCDLGVSAP
jgi:hypothetical protein